MKDRIPTYPGRVTLMPVSGQANTYDMERADQPTEAGTPLNKNTFLKDTTAQKLGLTQADPTVDDAFNGVVNTLTAKVGDTLTTVRTDLGEDWLLCNGDAFGKEYSDLFDRLPFEKRKLETVYATASRGGGMAYGDGYYVVASGNSGDYPQISYTTDIAGEWTHNTKAGAAYDFDFQSVAYGDHKWVAVTFYGKIYTATTPDGTWTNLGVPSTSNPYGKKVIYDNGEFIVLSQRQSDSKWAFYRSADLTTWTEIIVEQTGTIYNFKRVNGLYVVCSDSYVYYAENLDGTWNNTSYITNYVYDVVFEQNKWVASGSDSEPCGWVAYADGIAGTWTKKKLMTRMYPHAIFYDNGTWVLCGPYGTSIDNYYNGFAYATDLDGSWSVQYATYYNGSSHYFNGAVFVDSTLVTCSRLASTTMYITSSYQKNLPAISTDGAYTYIKAK